MVSHISTTPFGRRTLTLAHVASQADAKERPPEKAVHKWNIFRAICTAKSRLGVTERALAVLDDKPYLEAEILALPEQDEVIVITDIFAGSVNNEFIRYLHQQSGGKFPIIAVGGIMTAADAMEKLNAGATLVQLYTGFIYEGPGLIKEINKSILARG